MLLTKEQKNCEDIKNQLVNLWCEVFGDSEEYVRLLIPFLPSFDCYAAFEGNELVSAMYLLPSEIRCVERLYKGRYLYAAATKEKCRKNGYMSLLINEAIDTLKERGDFISLVPANDGLYSYYARFGFEAVMYNFVTELEGKGDGIPEGEVMSAEEINKLRKECFNNAHLFTDETMEYALSCYRFFGSEFIKKDNCSFLYVEDENTVYEALSGNKEECLTFLENSFKGRINAVSPYKLTEKSEKVRCGMVKAFSDALKNEKEIYMNHTLM